MLVVASCSSSTTPERTQREPASAAAPAPKPADESRRFPQANLLASEVVDNNLLGKDFMPGGTVARYKKGKSEYQMFVARTGSAAAAAVILSQWRSALNNPQFVASFGGYFGGDPPVFVFTKGEWIAGVVGLNREQADAAARQVALRLEVSGGNR